MLKLDSRTIALLSVLACNCCFVGCTGTIAGDWVFREVKRVRSPGGQFEAVILTGDGGATTREATLVRILRTGEKIGTGRPPDSEVVLWASDVKNLVVLWKLPRLVDIHFDEASIDLFKNHEDIPRSQDKWDVIEARLCPTSPDFSLPERDR